MIKYNYISSMGRKKVVLIGDVIQSRKGFNPEQWENFHQSLRVINENFKNSLKIPLTVYSGDSFGAVCRDIETGCNIVLAIQEKQRLYSSRMVLIEDEINYGLDKKSFLTLEGPALWKSVNLLRKLKTKPNYFLSSLEDELMTRTTNTILNLILSIRSEWNTIEWQVYQNVNKDIKQNELAKELDVSQQYISKIIRHSRVMLVKQSEENLKFILNGINNYIHHD